MLEAYGISLKGKDHIENEDAFLIDKKRGVFAVADGVTIPSGGREASQLAIALLKELLDCERFEESLESINQAFFEEKQKNPTIGYTTLTVLCIKGRVAKIANIGDSPAFLIRGNEIKEVYVSERTAFGIRAMDGIAEFHLNQISIKANDVFCLCTDGISDYIKPREILKIINKASNLEIAAKEIVEYVKAKPQPYDDDKTIVLVRVWE